MLARRVGGGRVGARLRVGLPTFLLGAALIGLAIFLLDSFNAERWDLVNVALFVAGVPTSTLGGFTSFYGVYVMWTGKTE